MLCHLNVKFVLYNSSACVCKLRYPAYIVRMRHIVMCGLPIYNVFPLSHKRQNFIQKILNTKCVFRLSLQILSETFLVLRRMERDVIKYVYWSSCKVPATVVRF